MKSIRFLDKLRYVPCYAAFRTIFILLISVHYPGTQECDAGYFKCITSGHCINHSFKCDAFHDCLDGSDEVECHGTTTSKPAQGQKYYTAKWRNQQFDPPNFCLLLIRVKEKG